MKNVELNFLGGKQSYILEAKNAIDPDLCSELIGECNKYYKDLFSPGPTIGGINPFVKSSMDFNFSSYALQELGINSMIFANAESTINQALFGCIAYYQKTYNELWHWPGITDTGFRLQHYGTNWGHYRQHVDGTPWSSPNPLSGSVGKRVLAGIVYLNDVEVGGETYFPIYEQSVKPRAGSIAIFPAHWTHPHQGNPPISGDKWMISTFYLCSIQEDPEVKDDAPEEKAKKESK
jgi:hypothetical protein